jgi:hypothetical protein
MKRPESVNDAELRKYGAKSMNIRSISIPDLAGGDPYFPISPRIAQSPGSAIRTSVRPHAQPLVIPADSFTMNFEFPAIRNRGLHRERPKRKEPTRIAFAQPRIPSRREVRLLFRKRPQKGPAEAEAAAEEPAVRESIFALPLLMV